MPDLMIYHPGTGTVIPLSDEVYLVNAEIAGQEVIDDIVDGVHHAPRSHKGYRIDNHNMGGLFYGGHAMNEVYDNITLSGESP